MKRIVSPCHKRRTAHPEAGFTLTELIVGLLVASILVIGLVELTRRYADTSGDIRSTVADARASRIVGGLFEALERADPGTLVVTPDRVEARIGGKDVRMQLEASSHGASLSWHSPDIQRSIDIPSGARFERRSDALVVLRVPGAEIPIAMATLRRDLPYDCQFDTVTLECRS